MAKKGGSQTVTQKPDPATQAQQQLIYQYGNQVVNNRPYTPYTNPTVAGVSDLSTGAAGQFQNASQLAGLGSAAVGGDAAAFGRFMNPYMQNVLGGLNAQYDGLRNKAALDVSNQATLAGAYGGDRAALLTGERMGAIDQAQMQQAGQLLYGGFNDAQQRAFQAANLGLGAAGSAFGAGDYFRGVQQQGLDDAYNRFREARDWGVGNLDILKGTVSGVPHGMSTTQPTSRNLGAGALGGALAGAQLGSMVPGIGTAIGAGLGGLFGMI